MGHNQSRHAYILKNSDPVFNHERAVIDDVIRMECANPAI